MSRGRVAVQFAGCGGDTASREQAFRQVHDELIAHNPVRWGPVKVAWLDASAARDQLRIAGLEDHPEAPGLIRWLEATPGSELVIGMVEVPPEGGAT